MPKRMLAAAALLSAASACSATSAVTDTDVCGPWEPSLRFSAAAVQAMDEEDIRQLDVYYGTGERLCGWSP